VKTTHRGDLEWPAFVRPLKRLDEEYGVSAEEANANYNPHTQQYDVAMLTLSRLLGLTPMRVVNSSEIYLWIPGVVARIIGWGTISYNGRASNWLLEANAPICSDLECAAAYGSIPASAPNPRLSSPQASTRSSIRNTVVAGISQSSSQG
jgi:hypothetical protein